MLRLPIPLLLLAPLVTDLGAQTRDDAQLWTMWLGQGRLGTAESPWRWWMDVHGRWREEGEEFDSAFVRPGVGYALEEDVTAWLGYAHFQIDPPNRSALQEQRIWQQLTFPVELGSFHLAGRARLEQRFLEDQSEVGWRLRLLFKHTADLDAGGRLFASFWNEAFLDLNETAWGQRPGVRQNRAFVGLGWRFGEERRTSVEVGYLNQWLDRPQGDALNHILSINLIMTF